jgi:multidrug efflux pump subunit AcrB
MKNNFKEFFATSWSIDNKTSIYVLTVFITFLGLYSYQTIPKEQFPDIVIPTILVNTIYPGTSPEDIENLVTRPIEKKLKGIQGVKKITSNSLQDYSIISVEFNTDIPVPEAKQRVVDAVDKSKSDLPNTLLDDPMVADIDFSEIPIMYIQISGDYDLVQLKKYAETAQDRIEYLNEITRVDIVGALEREIQVNVDLLKAQAAKVTMADIERSVASENLTLSAGNITNQGSKRSIRVTGQFSDMETIRNLVISSSSGALVYLKDVAEVKDSFKEQESFSRLNGKNVITLNVVKKSGMNLLEASDKIRNILDNELINNSFPSDLEVTVSGEMSRFTRNTLEELNNTMLFGFILVTIVLMFFMGITNAFFVALAVPLSMFLAFMVMPAIGFSMNMIVMFAFIFALGIVVDDAIVVIENIHRIHRFEPNIIIAAKKAAGEVFMPILSGTLTTLAPFFPLAFWPGIVGEFMFYVPVTLIITLFASLAVAYIINPVFAISFMRHEYDKKSKESSLRKYTLLLIILIIFAGLMYLVYWTTRSSGAFGFANFAVFTALMVVFFHLVITPYINWWQNRAWPYLISIYERQLRFFVVGNRPIWLLITVVGLLIFSFIITGITKPKVLFFPDNMPNRVFIMVQMPVGTDQLVTDSVTNIVEKKVMAILGDSNPIVESVISNVAVGAGDEMDFSQAVSPEKGKVTVNFVEYKYRNGVNTTDYLDRFREEINNIPGADINIVKENAGPPTGKPINIEITGEDLPALIQDAHAFKNYLDSLQIPGVAELKSDFLENKPEIIIDIDRVRANMVGVTTGQIAMELRTAVLGKEISKYKDLEDEYPIQLRYSEETRKNVNNLINIPITFRDMNTGMLKEIPLSSLATIDYGSSYGGIKRQDLKRIITIYSEVNTGYSPNDIVPQIEALAADFPLSEGVQIKLTGEQEDQEESSSFLGFAMMISIGLIFFILITQFNSFIKAVIILSEVIFSIIGVLLGIAIFGMDVSVIMTGLGIVALGGIVVRNGILIVEFTDVLRARGLKTREAIVKAGLTRITPVILTATATILGLVPLALGFNLNFLTAFTELNPQIHVGGDNVMFWGPLAWSIIFGLSFATFLTLVFVPAMYFLAHQSSIKISRWKSNRAFNKKVRGK